MTPKKLRGKGDDRHPENIEAAIRFYKAVTKKSGGTGTRSRRSIAFSGEGPILFTPKPEMNGFPEADTRSRFDEDDSAVAVANKYLTGFEPRLTTKCVAEKLQYVLGAEALSAAEPFGPKLGKADLFILDFLTM